MRIYTIKGTFLNCSYNGISEIDIVQNTQLRK